jgi:hypothetical protein
MACRTGCKTQDHANWGECARAANLSISAGESAPAFYAGKQYDNKTWNRELNAFDSAVADGISPEGTTMDKVASAVQASKLLGRPYQAESDPPAKFITSKNTAAFVKDTVSA